MRKFWPTSGFARARGLAVIAVVFLFPAGLEADTFSYDAAGRLYSSQQGNGLTITYAPDAEANILSAASSGTDTTDQGGAGNGLPDWWEFHYLGERGSDPLASSAGDGVANLMKYALGISPLAAVPVGAFTVTFQTYADGLVYPYIAFVRSKDAAGQLVLQQSSGGGVWNSGPAYLVQVGSAQDLGNGTELVTMRSLTPMPAGGALAFRLAATGGSSTAYFTYSAPQVQQSEPQDIPALPGWALGLLAVLFMLAGAWCLRPKSEAL